MSIDEELERVMANVSPEWRKQWIQPVTFDRTSGKYTPATQSEWESVCAAAGVQSPDRVMTAEPPSPPSWANDAKRPVLDGGIWLRSRPGEKHGPNETGASGPCDADCRKCAGGPTSPAWRAPDPLDEVIDGHALRDLLRWDERFRREWFSGAAVPRFSPAQRAAVSAHWSAELRAKVEAKRKADAAAATSVRYCEVEPWE